MVVEVVLGESSIDSVSIAEEGETFNLSDGALTSIPAQIVEHQSTGIDVVTGATYTSRAIMTAVENALTEAGGEAAFRGFSARVLSEPWSTEEITVDADVVVVGRSGRLLRPPRGQRQHRRHHEQYAVHRDC